jgi:hypothetical protein
VVGNADFGGFLLKGKISVCSRFQQLENEEFE